MIRKPLSQLKDKDLQLIRDDKIKDLALAHLAKYDSYRQAFVEYADAFGMVGKNGQFTPVRSVRLEYPLKVQRIGFGNRVRHIKTGGNHHVEIFSTSDKKGRIKWRGEVISTLHATQRRKDKLPLVSKNDSNGNPLVMALHINDMLLVDIEGQSTLCRVQKMSQKAAGNVVITLRKNSDASMDRATEINKSPESLRNINARQVYVDVLGTLKGLSNEQTHNRN